MSDSDSDPEVGWPCLKRFHRPRREPGLADEFLSRWQHLPSDTRRIATQRMRICVFWFPILLQRETQSKIVCWATDAKLINSGISELLTVENLLKIEALEMVLRLLEKGSMEVDKTKHMIMISSLFRVPEEGVLCEAFHYLKKLDEPTLNRVLVEFGNGATCHNVLNLVFNEFSSFILEIVSKLETTMEALMHRPSRDQLAKCEEMKNRGNQSFQKEKYDEAIKFYSKAISCFPDNHIPYGNRALCYIRCKKYLHAISDGKKAVLINQHWAKGHYRFAEALFYFGEYKMAMDANMLAQKLCGDEPEGLKDLQQQQMKFISEITNFHVSGVAASRPKDSPIQNFKDGLARNQTETIKLVTKCELHTKTTTKTTKVKVDKHSVKNVKTGQAKTKEPQPTKSECPPKNGNAESENSVKKKSKKRNIPAKEAKQKASEGKVDVRKEFISMVQDGAAALQDLRSRNAEQAFGKALELLENNGLSEFGVYDQDEVLLLFGRTLALVQIGQPEELIEAQRLVEIMKQQDLGSLDCLIYYASGKIFLRDNRFAWALDRFSFSLQILKNIPFPCKLTWPLTKEVIKETQPDYLKDLLENAIQSCKFPPPPNAICRLDRSLCPSTAEIYFTDPDFKGFVQFCCCERCMVEYHIACWKNLKTSKYFEKSEKDFLHEPCFTPDCVGKICGIKIFGSTGLIKCKFEADISMPATPKKPKVNQTCTSLKKLKSKDERKVKRKLHKQTFQEMQSTNEEILQQKKESADLSQQKAWLLYKDRVLLQISQSLDLLREEKGLPVSALISSLKPWLEWDLNKGNQIAASILNLEQEQHSLGRVVELLLERKNRVWARILINQLSSCVDVNPKLKTWASQIDEAGLGAACSFFDRYVDQLEELDPALLLKFGPIEEMIIQKFGTIPEAFLSLDFAVTDHLKKPSEMRLFIWALEEHRDNYASCHNILDEYFDIMDGHCSVLKKSENNSPMTTKHRGRKKKRRGEPRGTFASIPAFTATKREDQDFFDEDDDYDDTLSFLHPVDSFSIPIHLRDQVADFEDRYNSSRCRDNFINVLDNNSDQIKESLYDYFAQILEEHGPLEAEDPLLVGELGNFPAIAQQKIKESGGFESLLRQSPRFIKVDRCIALAKHAVALQHSSHRAGLDDLDIVGHEPIDAARCVDYTPVTHAGFPVYVHNYSAAPPPVFSVLPNPYACSFQPSVNVYPHWSSNVSQEAHSMTPYDYVGHDLYTCGAGDGDLYNDPAPGGAATETLVEAFTKTDAAVQTCRQSVSSVAVNTELHEAFEICPGDINKQEKSNRKLEQDIQKMTDNCDKVDKKQQEDVLLLEEEIKQITANIQVTNKELVLFQQKLEEEMKKDQKEKKANQEALKALKQETDELVQEQGSLNRNIREKKTSYEAKLSDFLDVSNQLAAEKMSLEDKIKRCKTLLTTAAQRSQTAQLFLAESSRDQGLYNLYRELAEAKDLLNKLDEASHRLPNPELEVIRTSWRSKVEELQKKISTAEQQYKEQMEQVKNGKRVSELPPVNVNKQKAEGATAPLPAEVKNVVPQAAAQASRSTPPPVHQSPVKKPATWKTEPPSHSTVFDRAMESLSTMFPDYTRPDLIRYVQKLRVSTGGNLSHLTLEEMVGGVTQLILDHQERMSAARPNVGRGSPAQCVTPPIQAPVWQPVSHQRVTNTDALNVEDPCIICHDDMSSDDTCVLACRHSFHYNCIKSWLKEQSTCPTCRTHALLTDDFPKLPGRKRQAP